MANGRIIHSSAPIRICDIGGWTDTWFAGQGRVLNLAVTPAISIRVRVSARGDSRLPELFHVADLEHEQVCCSIGSGTSDPLVQACLRLIPVPNEISAEISITSDSPPGSSTGTSASTCVAVLAALDRLRAGRMTASELWKAAHRVETGPLARQSGIQDQIAAAYGGINYIEMDHYPQADVTPISLPRAFYRQLERQVSLIFVGERHRSSEVHERVIRRLEWTSGGAPRLSRLRRLAEQARDALLACDLRRFGDVMIENTDAQADLHPELVGERHRRIINVARRFGAWGWKVNGAGGEGGSVTILGQPRLEGRSETVRAILAEDPSFQLIPTSFSADGVRVTEQVPSAAAMR